MRVASVALFCSLTLGSGVALAQVPESQIGDEGSPESVPVPPRHTGLASWPEGSNEEASALDASNSESIRGFFLRVAAGLGYVSAGSDLFTISGPAVTLHVAPGIALADDLILHGDLTIAIAPGPNTDVAGGTLSTGDVNSLMASHFGLGLTYFFPLDLFVSGSMGLGLGSIGEATSGGGSRGTTSPGLSFNSLVGWQFLHQPAFALDLSAQFFAQSLPDVAEITYGVFGGAILFSFTLH